MLHSLEEAAKNIGLYVNSGKTEFMSFKKKRNISTRNGKPLKPVEQFTYLGGNISSTDSDVNTRIAKAWSATNKVSVIWRSDLPGKLKRQFFQAVVVSVLLYGCTTWTLTKP